MSKYTKGGWNRNIKPASKYPVIFAGRNTHVAIVVSKGLPESEFEANCDLIAGAPALLEAAELFWDFYKDLAASNPGFMGKLSLQDYARYNDALVNLPLAISKAKGIKT